MGVYWGLVIAVNANPVVGMIITGLVSVAFMAVFYSLYPEEYRKAGEEIISVGDLLLKPADELYDFDKQYAGSLGWFLTAITATMGTVWSGAITNSAVSAFITWSLGIATLFAALVGCELSRYHGEEGNCSGITGYCILCTGEHCYSGNIGAWKCKNRCGHACLFDIVCYLHDYFSI